jgi:hypothetical protein
MFKYLSFAKDIADVYHPDIVIGIPLYSDAFHEHAEIVQCCIHGAGARWFRKL